MKPYALVALIAKGGGCRQADGVSVTRAGGTRRCPYCREELQPTQEIRYCGTVHHAACLAEAGGCTVLGCRARPARRVRHAA